MPSVIDVPRYGATARWMPILVTARVRTLGITITLMMANTTATPNSSRLPPNHATTAARAVSTPDCTANIRTWAARLFRTIRRNDINRKMNDNKFATLSKGTGLYHHQGDCDSQRSYTRSYKN